MYDRRVAASPAREAGQERNRHEGFTRVPGMRPEYPCADRNLYACPGCAHEWATDVAAESSDTTDIVNDAHGTALSDGNTVTLIRDLMVKETSSLTRIGARGRSLCLGDGDHNRGCRIDAVGAMKPKPLFVKKAQ
jgi:protein PhnA